MYETGMLPITISERVPASLSMVLFWLNVHRGLPRRTEQDRTQSPVRVRNRNLKKGRRLGGKARGAALRARTDSLLEAAASRLTHGGIDLPTVRGAARLLAKEVYRYTEGAESVSEATAYAFVKALRQKSLKAAGDSDRKVLKQQGAD